ncbi:MAG: hypothetical protein IH600_05500, partial [Bacteroidetes bacterium]|nr:hypothetical protein [Bacteroidota bacterium]
MTPIASRVPSAFLLLVAGVLACVACSGIPPATAWRPEVRSAGEAGAVVPGPYTLRVEMSDSSTAGSGAAIRRQLGGIVEDMLARRGFIRVAELAEYTITFSYRGGTRYFQEWRTEVNNVSTTTTSWKTQEKRRKESEQRKGDGKGETVKVGKTENTNTSTSVTSSTDVTRHPFVATLEVAGADSAAIWQADARWESASPDILT